MNWIVSSKYFRIFVILLIFLIAFQPCVCDDNLYINQRSRHVNESVEFTVEIYGLNEIIMETMNLSKDEICRLDNIFIELRKKINSSITQEETILLLEETVELLYHDELLPTGIDIINYKKLGTDKISSYNSESIKYQKNNQLKNNFLCMIVGKTNRTNIPGIPFTATYLLSFVIAGLSYIFHMGNFKFLANLLEILLSTLFIPTYLLFMLSLIYTIPIHVGSFITFGYRTSDPKINHYHPSNGWIWTNGLNGIKEWKGSFVGDVWFINSFYPPEITKYYIGAVGFTGIKIGNNLNGNTYLLGSSIMVGIDTEYPYP